LKLIYTAPLQNIYSETLYALAQRFSTCGPRTLWLVVREQGLKRGKVIKKFSRAR